MEALNMKCKLGETTFRWLHLHVIFSGYLVKLDGGINGVSYIPGMSKTHLPFACQKIAYLKRKSF